MPFPEKDYPDSHFDGAPTPRILDEEIGLLEGAAVIAGSALLMTGVVIYEVGRFVQETAAPAVNRVREFGIGVLNIGSKS